MNIQERIKFVLQSEAEAISNINVTADFTLAVELMLEDEKRQCESHGRANRSQE